MIQHFSQIINSQSSALSANTLHIDIDGCPATSAIKPRPNKINIGFLPVQTYKKFKNEFHKAYKERIETFHLKGSQLDCLEALINCCDVNGVATISKDRLAKKIKRTPRTVYEYLKFFVKSKLISVEKNDGKWGKCKTYNLIFVQNKLNHIQEVFADDLNKEVLNLLNITPISPTGEQMIFNQSQNPKTEEAVKPKKQRRVKAPRTQLPKSFPVSYANGAASAFKDLSIAEIALICLHYDEYAKVKQIVSPVGYLRSLVAKCKKGELKEIQVKQRQLTLDEQRFVDEQSKAEAVKELERMGIIDPSKKIIYPVEYLNAKTQAEKMKIAMRSDFPKVDYLKNREYIANRTSLEFEIQKKLTNDIINKST